jgi:hypothetical protein
MGNALWVSDLCTFGRVVPVLSVLNVVGEAHPLALSTWQFQLLSVLLMSGKEKDKVNTYKEGYQTNGRISLADCRTNALKSKNSI